MRLLTSLAVLILVAFVFAQATDVRVYGHSPDWGLNGKFVTTTGVYSHQKQIVLWDLSSGKKQIIGRGSNARFSPN